MSEFPGMDEIMHTLDYNHNILDSEYRWTEGRSLMPGILSNANVAIKEAVGLVSAGSQRALQRFTFHRRLQPRGGRVLLGQALTVNCCPGEKSCSSNSAGPSLSREDWK